MSTPPTAVKYSFTLLTSYQNKTKSISTLYNGRSTKQVETASTGVLSELFENGIDEDEDDDENMSTSAALNALTTTYVVGIMARAADGGPEWVATEKKRVTDVLADRLKGKNLAANDRATQRLQARLELVTALQHCRVMSPDGHYWVYEWCHRGRVSQWQRNSGPDQLRLVPGQTVHRLGVYLPSDSNGVGGGGDSGGAGGRGDRKGGGGTSGGSTDSTPALGKLSQLFVNGSLSGCNQRRETEVRLRCCSPRLGSKVGPAQRPEFTYSP